MSQHYIFEREDTNLPKMQVVQLQKQKITGAQYVLIYKGLKLMFSNGNLPVSKYRISNNKAVIDIMIQNQLLDECCDRDKIVSEYFLHRDTKYYTISRKGFEYLSLFERLESLFD
jgi:hypothetical protein